MAGLISQHDVDWANATGSQEVANRVTSTINVITSYRDRRVQVDIRNAKLYGNQAQLSAYGPVYSELATAQSTASTRISFNIIQSCIDTVTARVAGRIRPTVMWATSEGNYKARRRAKKLNRFTYGFVREQRMQELGIQIFRDSCIFGSGLNAIVIEGNRVKLERVLQSEIFIDEVEALHGCPRELHRVKPVDISKLKVMFPSKMGILNQCESVTAKIGDVPEQSIAVMVSVRESWRLPDGPDNPGRHVITILNGTLLDEEWKHDFFPFVKMNYNDRCYGFWGQPLAEILADTQVAINKHLNTISYSLHMMGSYKIAIEMDSKVNPNHLGNMPGAYFFYRRQPPVFMTPPAVQSEVYTELQRLINQGYQLSGCSQLTAAGLKQPGVNAAVAMREMVDIENDRFSVISQRYEQWFMDNIKIAVEMIQDLVNSGKDVDYTVCDISSKRSPIVNWKDIDFKRDEFTLFNFPVASLPEDPEAREQTVTEWAQAGWIDQKTAMRLMHYPDISMWESLNESGQDYVEYCVDKLIDENTFIALDATEDDINYALEYIVKEITFAKVGELEPTILNNMRRWRDDVQRLISKVQAQAQAQMQAAQAAAQPSAPIAKPQLRPTSDLLPVSQ